MESETLLEQMHMQNLNKSVSKYLLCNENEVRTDFVLRTDGRTDGQADGQTHGQQT